MIPFLFRRYDALNEMEFNFNESTILNEKLQQITDKTKRNKTKKNSKCDLKHFWRTHLTYVFQYARIE